MGRARKPKQEPPISFRAKPFTRRRLEEHARRQGESRNAVIERAVRKLLDEEEQR